MAKTSASSADTTTSAPVAPPDNPAGASAISDAGDALAQQPSPPVAPSPIVEALPPSQPRMKVAEVKNGRPVLDRADLETILQSNQRKLRVYRGNDLVGVVLVGDTDFSALTVALQKVSNALPTKPGVVFDGVAAGDELELFDQRPVRPDGVQPGDRGGLDNLKAPGAQVVDGVSATTVTPRVSDRVLFCWAEGHERGAEITRVHAEEQGTRGRKTNLVITVDGRDDDVFLYPTEKSGNNLGDTPRSHVHRAGIGMSQDGKPQAGTWRYAPRS